MEGVGMSLANYVHTGRYKEAPLVRVVICSIRPRTPAALCGRLAVGDEILEVDENSTEGMDASAVSNLVRGRTEGSVLRLFLRKGIDDATSFEVYLMRSSIHAVPSSPSQIALGMSGSEMVSSSSGNSDGTIGTTVANGQEPGTWLVKFVKPGGGAWLGFPDWSRKGCFEANTCLQDGDAILSVDGIPVCKIEKPQDVLRGVPFTRVSLQILRSGLSWCVDVIRTPLLVGSEIEMCSQYKRILGDKLKQILASENCRWQHYHDESALTSKQRNIPEVMDPTIRQQFTQDHQNLPTGKLLANAVPENSKIESPAKILDLDSAPHNSNDAGMPCGSLETSEIHWQVQTSFPHIRERSVSPAGSVDSLDGVIQQLDKASSLEDTRLKLFPSVASSVITSMIDSVPDHDVRTGKKLLEDSRKNQEDGLPLKEPASEYRPDRSLCIQRDLSWLSPKRTPGRKSRSRRSSRSPSERLSRDHRRRQEEHCKLEHSGPVHLRVPDNWSAWSYAGEATYIFAIHFQSGLENTQASSEMQRMLNCSQKYHQQQPAGEQMSSQTMIEESEWRAEVVTELELLMHLKLDMSFSVAGETGSSRRDIFGKHLLDDLAGASNLKQDNYSIKRVSPGSIIVDIQLVPSSSVQSTQLVSVVEDLKRQATDPDSRLRAGILTRNITSIQLASADDTLPDHFRKPSVDSLQVVPRSPFDILSHSKVYDDVEELDIPPRILKHGAETIDQNHFDPLNGSLAPMCSPNVSSSLSPNQAALVCPSKCDSSAVTPLDLTEACAPKLDSIAHRGEEREEVTATLIIANSSASANLSEEFAGMSLLREKTINGTLVLSHPEPGPVFEFNKTASPGLFKRPTGHDLLHHDNPMADFAAADNHVPDVADAEERLCCAEERPQSLLLHGHSSLRIEPSQDRPAVLGKVPAQSHAPSQDAVGSSHKHAIRETAIGKRRDTANVMRAAKILKLLQQGFSDEQIVKHESMAEYHISLTHVSRFRQLSGVALPEPAIPAEERTAYLLDDGVDI
jgi:hypothetical protein